jgi:uncharacterized delta-60 repeat protein
METNRMWPQIPLTDQKAAPSGTRAKPLRRPGIRRHTKGLHPRLEGLEGRLLLSAGDLDLGFGTGGKVTTDFSGGDRATAVVLQSDGKIVLAGFDGSGDFALARYNADGSLDTTFGSGGKVTTDFAGGNDSANAVALQSDGKIIVAGTTYTGVGAADFALARYNADGSLDTRFGSGGKVTTDFSRRTDHAQAVAIQSDGKIVVAGQSYTVGKKGYNGDDEFALARYNADGSLDTGFGSRGKVLTSIGSGASDAFGVALQGDGKIVVAGRAIGSSQSMDIAVARYTAGGSLDTTFGSGGTVLTDFAGYGDQALGVALQGDGKIVAAGETNPGSSYDDFALVRYTTTGSLDTTFGSGGKVTTDFAGYYDRAYSVAIQSDGEIVAAGRGGGAADFALARYTTSGSLDTGFGSGGKVTTDFAGSDDKAFGVAIQSDGKIVAAGYARSSTGYDDFALARYLRSATAPQTLGGAVAASTGATNPTVAYQSRRWGSTSISPDAVGAFPRGPLGVAPDMAPWVAVPPIAAHPRRSRGAPSLWLMTLNPDSLPLADRGS